MNYLDIERYLHILICFIPILAGVLLSVLLSNIIHKSNITIQNIDMLDMQYLTNTITTSNSTSQE